MVQVAFEDERVLRASHADRFRTLHQDRSTWQLRLSLIG